MESASRSTAALSPEKQFSARICSKTFFAGIRDLVGGRSATYEKELQRAREIALEELRQRAQDLGANAVIGIDIDYEIMGKDNGMLMVSASGTAVIVETIK
jgi:uncharacterized protein YbjQ (UPF0145 family)